MKVCSRTSATEIKILDNYLTEIDSLVFKIDF